MATRCPNVDVLQAFLVGHVSADDSDILAAHVEGCQHCVSALARMPSSDRLVAALQSPPSLLDETALELAAELMTRLVTLRSDAAGALDPAELPTCGDDGATPTDHDPLHLLAPAQQPGELGRLGPYRVLQILGRGGMGIVFQGHDPQMDRMVALKVMLPPIAANPSAKQRFLREARAAGKLRSDYIVTTYQVGEDRGIPYLAMEYLEGETLHQRLLRSDRLSVAEIMRIARDVAQGLADAHASGLTHRDIKPGNIWLESRSGGRAKLLDFGLARTQDDVHLTQSDAIVGTPAYIAPEQAHSKKVDGRADLFSLGCVLYRLCTGDIPFKAETTMGVLLAVTTHIPTPLDIVHAPRPLADLIMQLLEKAPAHRPASAREVVERLTAIALELNETTTRPLATPAPKPISRTRSPILWLTLVCGFFVLCGGAFGIYQLFFDTPEGRIVVEVQGDDIEARFKKGKLHLYDARGELLATLEPGQRVKSMPAGKYGIKVTGADGVTLSTDRFELTRGKEVVVRVHMEPSALGKNAPILPVKGAMDAAKPFLLTRAGQATRAFKTFAAVHAELQKGDAIEVHGNGPFELGRTKIGAEGLTLRAAAGYRPRLVLQKAIFAGPPGDWFNAQDAEVSIEGCDFECAAFVHTLLRGRDVKAAFKRCRFQMGEMPLAVCDGSLHLTDCLVLAPTHASNSTLLNGKFTELELNNCVALVGRRMIGLEDTGATVRLHRCTIRSAWDLVSLPTPLTKAVSIELKGCVLGPSFVHLLTARKDLVRLQAADNLYVGDLDMVAWRKRWGDREQNSKAARDVVFAWEEPRGHKTFDGALPFFQKYADEVRQQMTGRLTDLGPDWALVGPGEAYVRALALAGKPGLRPPPPAEGPIVILRGAKEMGAFRTLADAFKELVDDDVVEIRSDAEYRNVTFGSDVKRSLTLRAAPGYRPILTHLGRIGKGSDWRVNFEGLEFRDAGFQFWDHPRFTIARMANCSFWPRVDTPAGAVFCQGNGKVVEFVNCLMPGDFAFDVPPGHQLLLRNSLVGALDLRPGSASAVPRHLEFDRCLQWAPGSANAILGRSSSNGDKLTSLAIAARATIFETGVFLAAGQARQSHLRWNGSGNVYRKLAGSWFGSTRIPDIDLTDVRGRWKSDADSEQGASLLLDPAQWRLVNGGIPDVGAVVDRLR